jgi:hypothetical protein
MHEQGKAAGNSPQEVAIHIASQLPLIHRVDLRRDLFESWISWRPRGRIPGAV